MYPNMDNSWRYVSTNADGTGKMGFWTEGTLVELVEIPKGWLSESRGMEHAFLSSLSTVQQLLCDAYGADG